MKTRVLKRFDTRNAVYVWIVEKWSLWDPPDLRAAYPNTYDWRYVRTCPEEQPAKDAAQRIAEHGRDPCSVERDGGDGETAEVVFECGKPPWIAPKYFFPVATLNQMQTVGEFFFHFSQMPNKMSIEVDGQDVIIRYADMDTEWLKELIADKD